MLLFLLMNLWCRPCYLRMMEKEIIKKSLDYLQLHLDPRGMTPVVILCWTYDNSCWLTWLITCEFMIFDCNFVINLWYFISCTLVDWYFSLLIDILKIYLYIIIIIKYCLLCPRILIFWILSCPMSVYHSFLHPIHISNMCVFPVLLRI